MRKVLNSILVIILIWVVFYWINVAISGSSKTVKVSSDDWLRNNKSQLDSIVDHASVVIPQQQVELESLRPQIEATIERMKESIDIIEQQDQLNEMTGCRIDGIPFDEEKFKQKMLKQREMLEDNISHVSSGYEGALISNRETMKIINELKGGK